MDDSHTLAARAEQTNARFECGLESIAASLRYSADRIEHHLSRYRDARAEGRLYQSRLSLRPIDTVHDVLHEVLWMVPNLHLDDLTNDAADLEERDQALRTREDGAE